MNKPTKECACVQSHYNSNATCSCQCHFEPLEEKKGSKTEKSFMDMMEKDMGVKFVDVTPLEEKKCMHEYTVGEVFEGVENCKKCGLLKSTIENPLEPKPGWEEEFENEIWKYLERGNLYRSVEYSKSFIKLQIEKAKAEEKERVVEIIKGMKETEELAIDDIRDFDEDYADVYNSALQDLLETLKK